MGRGGPKGASVPCRFFGTPQGCSNAACPFLHAAGAASSARGGRKGAAAVPCKFFGSARGCSNDACPFLHGSANASFSNYKHAAEATAKTAGDHPREAPEAGGTGAGTAQSGAAPCKFFGSAKGCSSESCAFSHASPNSVPPCSFKQKLGSCEKGEACTFRHVPWASPEEARAHYAAREIGTVETSTKRFKQLHRDDKPEPEKLGKEHVETETIIEREMQVETYGSKAVKMMEKMGYKTGSGLGKEDQGSIRLAKPCLTLEKASEKSALGFGAFEGSAKASVAERAARLASVRAQKSRRVDETAFVVNNLLSDDESSEDDEHVKARDIQLTARQS